MKKTTILTLIIIFSFVFSAESQVNLEWLRTYNFNNGDDIANEMAVDTSGNIYVTGKSSNGGNTDFATVKYSPSGQQIWVKRYSSPSSPSNDRARNVDLDSAGNVYVSGSGSNAGHKNTAILIKYSPSGNQEWIQSFNTVMNKTDDHLLDATLSADGNLYVTGYFYDSTSIIHPLVVKYNLDGEKLWSIADTGHTVSVFGSFEITSDNDGNVYVSSLVNYTALLVKYSSEGILLWERYIPGQFYDLAADSDGNIYGCGEKALYALTVKYSSEGQLLWRRDFRSATDAQAEAYSIGFDSENNAFTLGWDGIMGKDILLVKYDSSGNVSWFNVYNSFSTAYDEGHELAFDKSDNIYIVGISNSNNIINLKYDQEGLLKWVRTVYSGGIVYGVGIYVDNFNNVISAASIFETGQNKNYVTMKYSQLTNIQFVSDIVPAKYELFTNFPNPFNPSTIIRFSLPVSDKITLKVYDQLGKEIAVLADEYKDPGTYELIFDASGLSSGIYFYSLQTNNFKNTKKMILLK